METPPVKHQTQYYPKSFSEVISDSFWFWLKGLGYYFPLYFTTMLAMSSLAYALILTSGNNPWITYFTAMFIPTISSTDSVILPPIDTIILMFIIGLGIIFVVNIIFQALITGVVVKHSADQYANQKPSIRGSLTHTWSQILSIIGAQILMSLIILVITAVGSGLILIMFFVLFSSFWLLGWMSFFLALAGIAVGLALYVIALIYITTRLALYIPFIVLNGESAIDSLIQSWELVGDNFWRTFGVTFFIGLMVSAITAIGTVFALIFMYGSLSSYFLILYTVLYALAYGLATPLSSVAQTMIFHDLMGRYRSA